MALVSIELGGAETVGALYSWPNIPGSADSLADTVLHWFNQTLRRDGATDISPSIRIAGGTYWLDLDGPPQAQPACDLYAARLPVFLANGLEALNTVIPRIKAAGKWNPDPTNPGDIWRFFLPLGLPMINQRSLQFFHYPPLRLLDPMRDYLNDPVPVRWEELLRANGITAGSEALYECVMDATPIAAPDDQGSKKSSKGDPKWGLIPIQDFGAYQKAQVRLLLNPAPCHAGCSIPVVVYGAHPRDVFNMLYAPTPPVAVGVATYAAIVAGQRTPTLGCNHPYMFYAVAQGGDNVGSGRIADGVSRAKLTDLMIKDLAAARWQITMAANPERNPADVIAECTAWWSDAAQSALVQALIDHQGSLYYPNPDALTFEFKVPCPVLP